MPDLNELVDARFVPGDQTAIFSITSKDNPTVGSITYGDVVKLPRREALERDDFQIVGEEETSTGAIIIPNEATGVDRTPEAPMAESPESQLVAPSLETSAPNPHAELTAEGTVE